MTGDTPPTVQEGRTQLDNDLLTLDLPPGLTIKDLKGFIEAETNQPAASQGIYLNGQPVANETQTLEEAGIKDGEMLAVVIRQARPPPNAPQANRQRNAGRAGGGPDPEALRQQLLRDQRQIANLRNQDPELAAAVMDPNRWKQTWEDRQRQQQEAEQERRNQIALLNDDPFNVDAQKKIEELIRQDRVVENLEKAYNENPEVFVRVHMLYVNTEVNNVPVKAFVDSGAQATIMSPDCARRCGIMRLMDTRYAGVARGVGTAKILGRVHHAIIKIGGAEMPCAFTVMEGKDVDLLFGLDMLKRYKAKIDLEKNALCFEGIEVPFLHESEIPRSFEEAEMNEPTVAGPNGTEIGAKTGAVRPAGATASAEHSVAAGPSTPQAQSQSQPAASAAAGKAPEGSSSSSSRFAEADIEMLMGSTGSSRAQVIGALEAADGNLDVAASILMGF
ncbi:DNA damage-inducible protein 1 [Didymella sp. IMI 355093]|nr:DNA damage-inducible protein 1 [Didymella sp. IMI 355093]